jgi:hypothetical protein
VRARRKAWICWCAFRRSAPSGFARGKDDRRTRRLTKTRADDAWLFEIVSATNIPPRPEEARSAVSKDGQRPRWFETRCFATLLTMRGKFRVGAKNVDGRDKPGHDDERSGGCLKIKRSFRGARSANPESRLIRIACGWIPDSLAALGFRNDGKASYSLISSFARFTTSGGEA